ncbi:caspase domain-containing protein [Gymnopilus junonius]|uniref:Caspase domain-containing protein n=1 Tax=Gymnopilus junonius TaxID=109634 RepID=A0A9P5NHS5_GYMJU|nr:caspase domain-containing protein [Gymnopilus junonius]
MNRTKIDEHVKYALNLPLVPDTVRQFLGYSDVGRSTDIDNDPTSTPAFNPRPRMHALLIGIDQYKSQGITALRGAEADALRFKGYLENDLKVRTDQIDLILGKRATRSEIIDAFKRLANNERIQRDDPIFIFFAGHGSEFPTPNTLSGRGFGSRIEVLLPFDYYHKEPSNRQGMSANQVEVASIPDFVIGALINQIANKKGNNITVVFDCCHSASGTRDSVSSAFEDDDFQCARSVDLGRSSYNPQIDEEILSQDETRAIDWGSRYALGGSNSHILLAACGQAEKAYESHGLGNFTAALTKLLHKTSPDELRYCDILSKMDRIWNQHPQCEGKNRERFLFDRKIQRLGPKCYQIAFEDPSGQLVVEAGSINGVVVGSEFTTIADKDQKPVVLTVKSVYQFTSVLHCPTPAYIPKPFTTALLTRIGRQEDFRLYVAPQDPFYTLFRMLVKDAQYAPTFLLKDILLVENRKGAHLSAHQIRSEVVFELLDESATRYGFSHRYKTIDARDIAFLARFLGHAGHFFRTLNRAKGLNLVNKLGIEFFELEEYEDNEDGGLMLRPVDGHRNFYQNGVIDFVPNPNVPCGIKVVNSSKYDLYAYLFYFDCSDLSIAIYNEAGPMASYNVDPNLKAATALTFGYGSGGAPALTYHVPEHQEMDFGFLKLFVSNKAIDLSHVVQSSPFNSELDRALIMTQRKSYDFWASITVPIIQRMG